MKFFCLSVLMVLLTCLTHAIQFKPSNEQRLPHRDYGVPQQNNFHENVPLDFKYGPLKLDIIGRGGLHWGSYQQIKNHYGVPRAAYGPPKKKQQHYSPPLDLHGALSKATNYHMPSSQNLLLTHVISHSPHKIPQTPHSQLQTLPLFQVGPQFKPPHNPASSYGPPPSGPLNVPFKQIFGPPPPNYGPPPLPNFNNKHKTTGITAAQSVLGNHQQQPQHQGQIHIGAPANDLSATGLHPSFHTTCDGWKPIPYPKGSNIENSYIGSSYSQVVSSFPKIEYTGTATGSGETSLGNASAGGNGLPDKSQTLEVEALQLSLDGIDNPYNQPLENLYIPTSKYLNQVHQQSNSHKSSNINFGSGEPSKNFGRPQLPSSNYRPPLLPSITNLGPPPPPSDYYSLPPPGPVGNALEHYNNGTQAGLDTQYRKQSENLLPFLLHNGIQPIKPVVYRDPVPQGLFEEIGATVQHLDKFGVKPQVQAPAYIPPAANEIPQTGSANLNGDYGAPYQLHSHIPANIIEQQLPLRTSNEIFLNVNHQQIQAGNAALSSFVQQEPIQLQQQYLPSMASGQQHFNNGDSYTASSSASFHDLDLSTNQYHNIQTEQQYFRGCGHAPNFIEGGTFDNQQQHIEQKYLSGSGATYISQSIPPVAENSQFISGQTSSYVPSPSGGNEIDNVGYASEKYKITALLDAANPDELSGLDGLDIFSTKNSESIQLRSQKIRNNQTYQVQFGENEQENSNHGEILSANLLQTILNAVEQPQQQHQLLPTNHKAGIQSNIEVNLNQINTEDDNETEVAFQEFKVQRNDEKSMEPILNVEKIKPIVVTEQIKGQT